MKKILNLLFLSILGLTISSCEKEPDPPKLTKWIFELYEYGNIEPVLDTRSEFNIENGKITSYVIQNYNNGDLTGSNYVELEYEDSKLTATFTYNNNDILSKKDNYKYLENGDLDEYISFMPISGVSLKRKYHYTRDYKLVEFDSFISEDGIHYINDTTLVITSIQLFDDNDNQIAYTGAKPDSSSYTTTEYEFDASNNLIHVKNERFIYSKEVNPVCDILTNTYGKKVFWILPWIHKNFDHMPLLISENILTGIEGPSSEEFSSTTAYSNNGALSNITYTFSSYDRINKQVKNEFIYE